MFAPWHVKWSYCFVAAILKRRFSDNVLGSNNEALIFLAFPYSVPHWHTCQNQPSLTNVMLLLQQMSAQLRFELVRVRITDALWQGVKCSRRYSTLHKCVTCTLQVVISHVYACAYICVFLDSSGITAVGLEQLQRLPKLTALQLVNSRREPETTIPAAAICRSVVNCHWRVCVYVTYVVFIAISLSPPVAVDPVPRTCPERLLTAWGHFFRAGVDTLTDSWLTLPSMSIMYWNSPT